MHIEPNNTDTTNEIDKFDVTTDVKKSYLLSTQVIYGSQKSEFHHPVIFWLNIQ